MNTLQITYTVLGCLVAVAAILRFFIAPVVRAANTLTEHSKSITELKELLEATVVVVLDASETLQTISTELGIAPALKLARAAQERRVKDRRVTDRRRSS